MIINDEMSNQCFIACLALPIHFSFHLQMQMQYDQCEWLKNYTQQTVSEKFVQKKKEQLNKIAIFVKLILHVLTQFGM